MSPKNKTALRLQPGLLNALSGIKEREGIPVTTQIEFAIRDWLKKKGVSLEASSRRSAKQRKS